MLCFFYSNYLLLRYLRGGGAPKVYYSFKLRFALEEASISLPRIPHFVCLFASDLFVLYLDWINQLARGLPRNDFTAWGISSTDMPVYLLSIFLLKWESFSKLREKDTRLYPNHWLGRERNTYAGCHWQLTIHNESL